MSGTGPEKKLSNAEDDADLERVRRWIAAVRSERAVSAALTAWETGDTDHIREAMLEALDAAASTVLADVGQVVATKDGKRGCPAPRWDGGYSIRCGSGVESCAIHGPFETHPATSKDPKPQ